MKRSKFPQWLPSPAQATIYWAIPAWRWLTSLPAICMFRLVISVRSADIITLPRSLCYSFLDLYYLFLESWVIVIAMRSDSSKSSIYCLKSTHFKFYSYYYRSETFMILVCSNFKISLQLQILFDFFVLDYYITHQKKTSKTNILHYYYEFVLIKACV